MARALTATTAEMATAGGARITAAAVAIAETVATMVESALPGLRLRLLLHGSLGLAHGQLIQRQDGKFFYWPRVADNSCLSCSISMLDRKSLTILTQKNFGEI